MIEIEKIEVSSQPLYDLARKEYSRIITYLTECGYKVVYEAPYTYLLKDGKMWFSKCMECDTFSGTVGLFVAFYKMKKWDLPKIYKKCKISDLKSGDKFKIFTDHKNFYTYDVKSHCCEKVVYCLYGKNKSITSFDSDTTVFKID